MILFHTATGLIAVVAGLAVILLRKGTALHKIVGRVYVVSMVVLCLASFGIRDTTPFFRGFGLFHLMALVSLATVAAGIVPALFRSRFKDWYGMHFASMLWSYVGLIMALNSHFFRDVYLFFAEHAGAGKAAGLALSIALLWGLPPALGTVLINRRERVYRRMFGGPA